MTVVIICVYIYVCVCVCVYKNIYRVAQKVKNLLTMWETEVQSLVQVDPLEKGITAHSSILAWRIPWTEERNEVKLNYAIFK